MAGPAQAGRQLSVLLLRPPRDQHGPGASCLRRPGARARPAAADLLPGGQEVRLLPLQSLPGGGRPPHLGREYLLW